MEDVGRDPSQEPGRCPFKTIALNLPNDIQVIKELDFGQPILRGFLNLYLQNVVAIVHLLTGIGRKLIEVLLPSTKHYY